MLEATFEMMRAIVEAPECPHLQHYRDDFYIHDRAFLGRTWGMTPRYLWIIREMGSHLVPLGVHTKCHEEAVAAFDTWSTYGVYMVRPGRVVQISKSDAIDAMKEMLYTIEGIGIYKKGLGRICDLSHSVEWSEGQRLSRVDITSTGCHLTHGDHLALICIAQCEAISRTQSLFAKTEWITLDGQDLYELSSPRALPKAA